MKDIISKMSAKEIDDRVNAIGRLFYLSSPELLGVIYDVKPAMTEANTGTYDSSTVEKLRKLGGLCGELDLKMAFSKKKYVINSPRGLFEEVELDDPRDGNLIIGIAKDQKTALSAVAHYHWKMKDSSYSRKFGKLMGYPDCCLDFGDYLNNNNQNPDNFGFRNPAVESLKRSKKIAWQLNIFAVSVLSHFPCSLNCEKSKNYVDSILEVVAKSQPDIVSDLKDTLKNSIALYWSCVDRILFRGDFKWLDKGFQFSEANYNWTEGRINSGTFYQENSDDYLKELFKTQKAAESGNRIVMADDNFEVFKDQQSLLKIKKENPWKPILIKSDTK